MPVDLDALARRYLSAQLAGDRREALRLIDEEGLRAGATVTGLQLRVIRPAQYEIGRLWQENVISVAQEHLATAISQLALAQLYQHLPRGAGNGRRVLVACVEGEQHDLGARMTADHLEMAGFDVRLLGANVPAASLGLMVRRDPPHLVALSATMPRHLPRVVEAINAVCEAGGGQVPIAVGGHAFADESLPGCDDGLPVLTCATVEEVVEGALRVLNGGPWRVAEAGTQG